MNRANALLKQIQTAYQRILGGNLTGIYIHGSLAFDCFRFNCSDIDFLVVVEAEPTLEQKKALIQTLLDLSPCAPPKGFEMSVVLKQDCQHFTHPLSYCLHYSNAHLEKIHTDLTTYCAGMHGLDPDLAAHITVTHAVGQVLCGPAIEEVFSPVPAAAYFDSLWYDIINAETDILENPVYLILNLCRVLAYIREKAVLSKAQGGLWGQSHLPENLQPLVRRAHRVYTLGTSEGFAPEELSDFARNLLNQIKEAM